MRRLLLLGVLALAGCRHAASPPTRVFHVRVAADPAFRQREDWRDLAAARIVAVSHLFEVDVDARLEPAGASEWTPDPKAGLEDKRRELVGSQSDGNWIFVAFTSPEAGTAEPGAVVPFDNRVLVFDFPEKTEAENTANLAHQLGHMLGAWHSPDPGSLMHVPPGSQYDRTAVECIRITRPLDTRSGIKSLSADAVNRLKKLWADSKADPAFNPLYQFYAASGYELMSMGLLSQAVEPLGMAVDLMPSDARPHFALATAYMLLGRYRPAAAEFRKLTEITPQSTVALNNLARALLQSGQAEEAVTTLRKASEMHPDNGSLHANMGIALARISGHLDEGIEELRQALRVNPKDENAKAALDAALAAKARGRK